MKLFFEKVFGKVPSSLFISRFKMERNDELTRHCGMVPVNLLLDNRRVSSELALQIDEEIPPVSKL